MTFCHPFLLNLQSVSAFQTVYVNIMERLSLHIEYLLLRHDCVVVPGFGAFINVRHAARYDSATDSFFPMRREVRFNRAIRHDDGLLAGSYARKHQISFSEGRELLRHESEQLLDHLQEDREVTLGRLGILRLEEGASGDTIRFVPLQNPDRMAAELGLHSVATHIIKEETARVASSAAQKTPRSFDTERNFYIAVNKTFARVAASVVLVIGFALSFLLPFTSHRPEPTTVVAENVVSMTNAEDVANVTNVAIEANEGHVADVADVADAVPLERPYCLIVATFRTAAEAESYIAANADSGYDLEAVQSPTLCRVAALRSADRDSALQTLNSADFKSKFAEAWIWKKN